MTTAARSGGLRSGVRRLAHHAHVARGFAAARRAISTAENGPATCPPAAYQALIRQLESGCESVIDIGTGTMQSLEHSPCRVRIGVEAHRPYLENRTVKGAVPIHAQARDLPSLFVPGSADLVTAMDVIEHFSPDDAREFLTQAEEIAAKRVLIATPRGFFEQEAQDIFKLGLGGEDLQAHRSGWEVSDFTERGYRVVVVERFHGAQNDAFVHAYGKDADPVDGLVAWKDRA